MNSTHFFRRVVGLCVWIIVFGMGVVAAGCGQAEDDASRAAPQDRSTSASPLVRARQALDDRRFQQAVEEADAVLAADSTALEALVVRARALAALGQLDAASAAAGRAVGVEPRYVDARLVKADVAVARGSLEAAAEDLNVAASIDSRTPAVLYRQIRVQAALQRYDRAKEAARQLLRVRPKDPEGLALNAALHRVTGQTSATRSALRALRSGRQPACTAWTTVADSLPGQSPFQTAAATLRTQHCE